MVTDVAREPAWGRAEWVHHWSDGRGCAVRADVVQLVVGARHCGWQRALVLFWAGGAPTASAPTYLRDPHHVVPGALLDSFNMGVKLPANARTTGFHLGRWTLFDEPHGRARVWLVRDDGKVERWPRTARAFACA